jgi:predicted MFS family arabinose efflux permease
VTVSRLDPLKNRNFRRLLLAGLISGVGDWGARIAFSVLLFERTHSAVLTSLVAVVATLPRLGPGVWLTKRTRRLSHRSVLISSDLLRAALWLISAAGLPIPNIFFLVFLAETVTIPFASRRGLSIRSTVEPEQLSAAIALAGATFQAAVAIGYFLGASSIAASPLLVLRLNAFTFLVSALLLVKLPNGSYKGNVPATFGRFSFDRELRMIAVASASLAMFAMAIEALIIPYVFDGLHNEPGQLGLLLIVVPATTIIVSLFVGNTNQPELALQRSTAIAIASAALSFITLASRGVPIFGRAVTLTIVAGSSFAVITSFTTLFMSRIKDDSESALLLSGYQSALMVSQGAGAAGIGLIADTADSGFAARVGVIACFVILAFTFRWLRPIPNTAEPIIDAAHATEQSHGRRRVADRSAHRTEHPGAERRGA